MFERNLFTTYIRFSLHSISNCAAVNGSRITLRRNWRCCVLLLLHRRSDSEKFRIWSLTVSLRPAASELWTEWWWMNVGQMVSVICGTEHFDDSLDFVWPFFFVASIRVFLLFDKLQRSACVTMIVHNFARTLGSCSDHNYNVDNVNDNK